MNHACLQMYLHSMVAPMRMPVATPAWLPGVASCTSASHEPAPFPVSLRPSSPAAAGLSLHQLFFYKTSS